MRAIKFRAWDGTAMSQNARAIQDLADGCLKSRDAQKLVWLQFTGLLDKNGKEIYEGDIVSYYDTDRFVQQSHPDINPEIDETVIRPNKDEVVFFKGCFTTKKQICEDNFYPIPLNIIGFSSIEEIRQSLFNDESLADEERETDCNGFEITEAIVGVVVIGNIHENPELLKA